MGGRQHLADAAIEALDHAIVLGMTGLNEAVVDAVLLAGADEAMTSGRITSPAAQQRSVNSLPLSVNTFWALKGA